MKTQRKLFLISLIAVVTVGAIFAVVFLSTDNRVIDKYEIAFRDSVSGLTQGANVQFNGINKGEVEVLWIDPDDPALVIVRIIVDADTPVKTDSLVRLENVGEYGAAIIQIIGGSKDAPFVRDSAPNGIPRIEAERHSEADDRPDH